MHTTKENKLWLLIEESLIANAQKPCISYKGVELSYSEVHKRVNLTTSFLGYFTDGDLKAHLRGKSAIGKNEFFSCTILLTFLWLVTIRDKA